MTFHVEWERNRWNVVDGDGKVVTVFTTRKAAEQAARARNQKRPKNGRR
jgi:hypothetical protein